MLVHAQLVVLEQCMRPICTLESIPYYGKVIIAVHKALRDL